MVLEHGKAINAEEVERIVSREFTPVSFASLCNSLAWATSGYRASSLPSSSERPNAKDGGIDAEWQVQVEPEQLPPSSLLGPGWNVYQYKQRDVFAQGRKATFQSLVRNCKGTLLDIYQRTNRRPARYVFFCNLDLMHITEAKGGTAPEKGRLKKALLYGYEWPDEVHIEIVGAAELAAFLNDCPHLRSAYFSTDRFSTWESAWNGHQRQGILQREIRTVGREEYIDTLRSHVDDPAIRVVVLCGPPGIGKTRLALEATRHQVTDTVFSLDPTLRVSDLLELQGLRETIVVVEDPETELAEALADQALANSNLKLIITLPTEENAPQPNFGLDHRVHVEPISTLSDEAARELLKEAGASFDYSLESWVLGQAGGNPHVLIVAAGVGEDLRTQAGSFVARVGAGLAKKVRRRLGDGAVSVLQLFSLLTFVGVKGKHRNEVETICKHLGGEVNAVTALNWIPQLEKAGLVVRRGSFVEVRPPILANHLTANTIHNRFDQLTELLSELSLTARERLTHRLRMLESEETTKLVRSFLNVTGTFANLQLALAHGYLLRLAASISPYATVTLIESSLREMNCAERKQIEENERRELANVLEDLLLRRETCARALMCLAWLAEAENEGWGNNATGVLCESFVPLHPQIPISLSDRLELLKWLLDSKQSTALRTVGIQAITKCLSRSIAMCLRTSSGPCPADPVPSLTWADVWEYSGSMLDLLFEIAGTKVPGIAQVARDALPRTLVNCAEFVAPERLLPKLRTATEWITGRGDIQISPSDFSDTLRGILDVYRKYSEASDGKQSARWVQAIAEAEELRKRLDQAPFAVRLRRWAGGGTRDGHDYQLDESGKRLYRRDRELSALVQELLAHPDLMTSDQLEWLLCSEAQGASKLFWWLGRLDYEQNWLQTIDVLGTSEERRVAFSSYYGGLAASSPDFVASHLDELGIAGSVHALAIVDATRYLGEDPQGVDRIEALIRQGRLDPSQASRFLQIGIWLSNLTPAQCLRLLKAIAQSDLSNAPAAIDMLNTWCDDGRQIEGELAEFAWQCLEIPCPISPNQGWEYNQVAARVTRAEPDRGFRLLAKLLGLPYKNSDCWNPLERNGTNAFWAVLCDIDKERALRVALSTVVSGPLAHFRVTWALPELVDLSSDGKTLLKLACNDIGLARTICECLSIDQPMFWSIALEILQTFPGDREIQDALTRSVLHPNGVFWGPRSKKLDERAAKIKMLLDSSEISLSVRFWLARLAEALPGVRDWERTQEDDYDIPN